MNIVIAVIVILITQIGQVLLIGANQETNPLLFIIPLDLIMLALLFGIAEVEL